MAILPQFSVLVSLPIMVSNSVETMRHSKLCSTRLDLRQRLMLPFFTGGPFRYTDKMGADFLVKKMEEFQGAYGDQFKPCDLLVDMAKSGKKFFS